MKTRPYLSLLAALTALLLVTYSFYVQQLKSLAHSTMEQWTNQERLNIAHNRILEAAASLSRWARFSQDIRGLKLKTRGGETILADGANPSNISTEALGTHLVAPMAAVSTAEVGGEGLRLSVLVRSTRLESEFLFFAAVIAIILSVVAVVISAIKNHESKRRLLVLRESFDALIEDREPETITGISKGYQSLWERIRNEFEGYKAKLVTAKKNAAVAQTVQMLAHDVRRPFRLVEALLGILGSAKDPETIGSIVERFVPDVRKSLDSVNGMISDVMEIGAKDSKSITEPVNPAEIIKETISRLFKYENKSEVTFLYNFQGTLMVDANRQKLGRVIANIISNADQAMSSRGKIWFETYLREEDGVPFVEFCIGNSGSYIPEEELSSLFEAFYTKNKMGGTGLGLAIAKKVVESHGGKIWCVSSIEKGVEFHFTLPAVSGTIAEVVENLPSRAIAEEMGP